MTDRRLRPRGAWLASSARGMGVLGMSVLGMSACGAEPYEPERGPDFEWLVQAYEQPTGEISPELLAEQLGQATLLLGSPQLTNNLTFIEEGLVATQQGFEFGGVELDADLPIVGKALVHQICPGEGSLEQPDVDANGLLILQVPIEDGALG